MSEGETSSKVLLPLLVGISFSPHPTNNTAQKPPHLAKNQVSLAISQTQFLRYYIFTLSIDRLNSIIIKILLHPIHLYLKNTSTTSKLIITVFDSYLFRTRIQALKLGVDVFQVLF